jgi:ATP-dependent Zn protease
MKITRKYTAAHEAGHAVVAVHQQVRFSDVYIADDLKAKGEGGAVHYLPEEFHPVVGCEKEVIRKMAGEAGVRIFTGRKVGRITFRNIMTSGMYGDWKSALEDVKDMFDRIERGSMYPSSLNAFISKQKFQLDPFIFHCYRKAYEILDGQREFHARVTKALIDRGRLTYKEVMEHKS